MFYFGVILNLIKITIDGGWGESSTTISNDEGIWSIKIKTPGAGGPFDVLISSEIKILLKKRKKLFIKIFSLESLASFWQ